MDVYIYRHCSHVNSFFHSAAASFTGRSNWAARVIPPRNGSSRRAGVSSVEWKADSPRQGFGILGQEGKIFGIFEESVAHSAGALAYQPEGDELLERLGGGGKTDFQCLSGACDRN